MTTPFVGHGQRRYLRDMAAVTVMPRHIEIGNRGSCCLCPVALAVIECLDYRSSARVMPRHTLATTILGMIEVELFLDHPPALTTAIVDYDHGGDMLPATWFLAIDAKVSA